MRNMVKLGLALLTILVIYILVGMYGNAPMIITNEPLKSNPSADNQPHVFPQGPMQMLPPAASQGGMQVIRSLLGLEVKFLNGSVNYPGPLIVNDFRYQALGPTERLVDAIKFQPLQGRPFLLLIAIGKTANGTPIIVPGKFDILRKTEREGFVLRDPHGRAFYYSGYVLATQAWRDLLPGQTLQDKFCKQPVPVGACSANNTVTVLLKKPVDPRKDIPFLALFK